MRYFLIALLFLSACHEPNILRGSGVETTPPVGYTKLCKEHPDFAGCPK